MANSLVPYALHQHTLKSVQEDCVHREGMQTLKPSICNSSCKRLPLQHVEESHQLRVAWDDLSEVEEFPHPHQVCVNTTLLSHTAAAKP